MQQFAAIPLLVWVSASLAQSSGSLPGSIPPLVPSQNFTQLLDHSSNNSATFNHSFQLDTTHFRPGGPILVLQNAEDVKPVGEGIGALNGHFFQEYAEEFGAITVAIEHRFFGTSFPEGFTGATPDDYKYLTLDNVIQDAVCVVEHVKETVPGANASRVIVGGGSYGGFLAAMFRIRAPEIFYGSVPISPSLTNFGPFANKSGIYAYNDWTTNVYYDMSYEASQKIKAAMLSFQDCVEEGDCSTIPGLEFCKAQPNATELAFLYEGLIAHYESMAQFNSGMNSSIYPPDVLDLVVNRTLDAETEGEVLRVPFEISLGTPNADCLDWQNPNITTAATGTVGDTWWVILCSYMPVGRARGEGGLLPAQNTTTRVDCPLPPTWWGPAYNHSAEWFDSHYGLSPGALNEVERLLIVNGDFDQSSSLSVRELKPSGNRNNSRVLNARMSHSESSYPTWIMPRGIRSGVDAARDTQVETIKAWLGL